MAYMKTDTILDKILAHKQDILQHQLQIAGETTRKQMARAAQTALPPRDFLFALQRDVVALIAEVKRASPSKGILVEDFDPVQIGEIYARNGAAAISVLTDERFFRGSLNDLRVVRDAVDVPVLRKDFIIDVFQVDEARANGADAVLLIVAALSDAQLADLYAQIRAYGMHALVEVHSETEMERALKLEAPIIGVNNRNLKTFEVDLATTARLAKMVPNEVVLVAESGIRVAEDVRQMGLLGANAALVGESLMKADDTGAFVRAFSQQKRQGTP